MKKRKWMGIIAVIVFIIVYVGLSIIAKDIYAVSVIVPFSAAALVR